MTANPVEPQLIWSGSLPIPASQGGATDSADLRLYVYSDKSVALTTGESFGKLYSHALKTLGTFNPRLKVGAGWIFSKTKYPDLQTLIGNITTGQIQPQALSYNKSPSRQTAAPNSGPRLVLRPNPSTNLSNPGLYHSANYDITGQTIPPPPGVRQNASVEPSVNQLLSVLLNRVGATNGTFETASPDRRYQRISIWGSKAEIERQVGDYQSRRAIEVARFVTPDRMALVLDLPNPDSNPEPTSPGLRFRPASPSRPASPPRIHSPSRPASPPRIHSPSRPASPPRIHSPSRPASPPIVRTPSSPQRVHSPSRPVSPSPPVIRTPSSPRGTDRMLGVTSEISQLSITGNLNPPAASYVSEEGGWTSSQLRVSGSPPNNV